MEKPNETEGRRGREKPENAWKFLHLGLQLAVTCSLFFVAGYFLDQHYNSTPWCLLGGGVVGLAVGLYHFLKETL